MVALLRKRENMKILGIDTSCDDTAISVVEIQPRRPDLASGVGAPTASVGEFKILSNIISSQVKLHAKYGGVYPSLAKREHQRNLPLVFEKAVREARLLNSKFKSQNSKLQFKIQNLNKKIDYIAVTVGPGLEPCLWQGINFAKELAEKLKKPLIPVNHIEGHIFANFLNFKPVFPAVCLVVSGGHTQLILMEKIGKYKLLGETRDDAAGECFDKTARILGLGYPGGPVIAQLAARKSEIRSTKYETEIKLPRPMMYTKDYDFSFSGLKTAVLYKAEEFKKLNSKIKAEFCREIQQSIIDVLIWKTLKAAKDFKVKSIILGGGVAANDELRKQFESRVQGLGPRVNFFVPEKILCTDNAAMVAAAAYFHRRKAANLEKIAADGNLKICPVVKF